MDGIPQSAGHTGSSTDDYKDHIEGPDYCIQGNILLGAEVLENMESNFINAEGDLACKLMAAMQGANMVGADSRCSDNNSSSLFAFLKVSQPDDEYTVPSFSISLRTHDGDQIEPIDSLQVLFDLERDCSTVHLDEEQFHSICSVFPNPADDHIWVRTLMEGEYELEILDHLGRIIYTSELKKERKIDLSAISKGTYLIRIGNGSEYFTSRFVKE